ncbi:MAG: hypothetical protein L6R42_006225 [Xanthoria sp. 1 TBL-2021]|nr:MAG: hypothetical protein L6R42_006225 [Xanthoria sp. 1 TBL-2021]
MSPTFERAIMEVFELQQEAASLTKRANKARHVLTQKINDLRAVHARNSDMLASDLLKPVALLIKQLEMSGLDCDITTLHQIVESEKIGQQGVTVPSPQDDLGQIYITFDPTVKCYRFTNSKAPEDPI